MDLNKSGYTLLDHTADLGIMVQGSNIQDLFVQAARAMMQIMISGNIVEKSNTINLSLKSDDPAELMVHWLSEILYLFHGEKEVVIRMEIDSISALHLDATLAAVPFDIDRHEVLCEIKAVTFHQIAVTEKDGLWEAKIIFDL